MNCSLDVADALEYLPETSDVSTTQRSWAAVERFAKVQALTLAHDIGKVFARPGPSSAEFLVETLRAELHRGKCR
jgi:hypothetical protein